MSPVCKILVDLFARLSCAEIEASDTNLVKAFNVASFDLVKAMPLYSDEYSRVRSAKLVIERIGARYSASNGDQPLQCLSLLKEWRDKTKYLTDEYETRRELIRGSVYQEWSLQDRDLYDARRFVIEEWSHFFLSYTNRESLDINNRYRKLISHKLGWPGQESSSKSNYVARVIAKFFESQNLRAFADFNVLECGDDIGEEIVQHCRSTFAFVQLVQHEVLSEPAEGKRNWCHIEYGEFVNATFPSPGAANVNRKFFLLSGAKQLEEPANMSQPYLPWYKEMSDRLHIVIDTHDRKPWDQLKEEVSVVARAIVAARSNMVISLLASWR